MAKANPGKVNPAIAERAIKTGKDRGALYSECVRFTFKATGRLTCGFDNKDLQAWIDVNYPEYGKIGEPEPPTSEAN